MVPHPCRDRRFVDRIGPLTGRWFRPGFLHVHGVGVSVTCKCLRESSACPRTKGCCSCLFSTNRACTLQRPWLRKKTGYLMYSSPPSIQIVESVNQQTGLTSRLLVNRRIPTPEGGSSHRTLGVGVGRRGCDRTQRLNVSNSNSCTHLTATLAGLGVRVLR